MEPLPWHLASLFPHWPVPVEGLLVLFGLLWVWHRMGGNTSLADVGFCAAFGGVVILCAVEGEGNSWRRWLIGGMGSVYAIRLGWHLFTARVWGKPEDPRYRMIREALGKWEPLGIAGYFLLQIPASLFFVLLLCWVMANPRTSVNSWDLLGVGIFGLAIAGEMTADRQLERFKADPLNRGKVLQSGLWRYSRHPNYFFEVLHWSAYVPLAVGLPWSWLSLIWPVVMLGGLLWISGVPWAEAQALASRGEAYRAYQRTTNKLFPWLPRQGVM